MHRTNIYLDEDQLRALKHLAVERDQSVAALVRKAVDEFLEHEFVHDTEWQQHVEALVQRVRKRMSDPVSPEDVENDITLARQEARRTRRAPRRD